MKNDRFWLNPIIWLLAVAALIFFALAHSVAYSAEIDLVKLQKQVLANTVQLDESCSGTVISSKRDTVKAGEVQTVQTLILTAKHCADLRKTGEHFIDFPVYHGGRMVKLDRYIATLKGTFYGADLGLYVLKDKQTHFPTVAKIAPEKTLPMMGEEVWTAGYPLAKSLTITSGNFGAFETIDFPIDGTEYFRATPNATYGNSGGALYRMTTSGDFELIGVTSAKSGENTFMTMYVPIDMIHKYLKSAAPYVVGVSPPPPAKAFGN